MSQENKDNDYYNFCIYLTVENPQCLQEIYALDEHQHFDSHEELEDHPSGLVEELS